MLVALEEAQHGQYDSYLVLSHYKYHKYVILVTYVFSVIFIYVLFTHYGSIFATFHGAYRCKFFCTDELRIEAHFYSVYISCLCVPNYRPYQLFLHLVFCELRLYPY